MRCGFCFATFQDVKQSVLPKGHLPKQEALLVVKKLCKAGFKKLNFAGGEPTLCPWLYDLVVFAKSYGVTTSIVTNGTRIDQEWLERFSPYLDWVGLSIDSFQADTNLKSGRAVVGKKTIAAQKYVRLCSQIKASGLRLKINTVVNSTNLSEDMSYWIGQCDPERWKLFQVLPVDGQNSEGFQTFEITDAGYQEFINRHIQALPKLSIVPESNHAMTGSYLMVDPAGRFFDNVSGKHTYSQPILEVGVKQAISEIDIDARAFLERGGLYDW